MIPMSSDVVLTWKLVTEVRAFNGISLFSARYERSVRDHYITATGWR